MKKIRRWLGYALLVFVTSVAVVFFIAYLKRDEIKQEIVDRFNERVNGNVTVDRIHFTVFHHFPDFSITLLDVALHDTIHHEPVIAAKKVYLDIGLYALFRNEIHLNAMAVDNGSVFLFRGKNGYSNSNVFKPKQDSSASAGEAQHYSLNINAIEFKQVKFLYFDSLKDKRISFKWENTRSTFKKQHGRTEMVMAGTMFSDELTFNNKAGGFLQNKKFTISTTLQYEDSLQQLTILPTKLKIDETEVEVSGEFFLNDDALYSLRFEANNLTMVNGLTLLNNRIQGTLERFKFDKPVNVEVVLRGKHKGGGDPRADVSFNGKDVDFDFEKLSLQKITFAGQYLHRPDSVTKGIDHSLIKIDSFAGRIEGVPFSGKVVFTELKDPIMELAMQSKVTHRTFNNLVDTTEWVGKSGTFTTSVRYKGKLDEYLDATRSRYYGKLSGNFRSRNGTFVYKPKSIVLKNVNAFFSFTEKQFTIDSLSMSLNGSPVSVKGSMRNYIPFFIQPANKGYVKLDLATPMLDLNFIASEEKQEKTKLQQGVERKRLTGVLNTIQRKLQFDITVNAADLRYKKFRAREIKGKVKLDSDELEASNLEMKVANGTMNARINFKHSNPQNRTIAVVTRINNADIREFFALFNDFGQKTIYAENLAGRISARANFSATVQRDYSIDPASMRGNISCNIKDGQLINFEPLENLSNFLFRKRDFSDVHFAELESNFDVNGLDIDIERMEVQSSVLSFFLQGRYSFKDSTSMSLQLPLNNLKKRDKNYKPENIGTNSKSGMSVYLHIYRDKDINSKINIAYDPFKKWVK